MKKVQPFLFVNCEFSQSRLGDETRRIQTGQSLRRSATGREEEVSNPFPTVRSPAQCAAATAGQKTQLRRDNHQSLSHRSYRDGTKKSGRIRESAKSCSLSQPARSRRRWNKHSRPLRLLFKLPSSGRGPALF